MISMSLTDAALHTKGELLDTDINFTGCTIDSRQDNKGKLFIAINGDRFDGHDFVDEAADNGAVATLIEKRMDQPIPGLLVKNSLTAITELAAYWRQQFNIPLIAVTGSNGKTTVKEMIFSILSEDSPVLSTQGNMNNHLGVPLTLFKLGKQHKYAVIEMGANHPGEISQLTKMARPTVAVITTCAPSHLEGFGSIEGVARAKAEIYQGLMEQGTAIINADDDYSGLWESQAGGYNQLKFSISHAEDVFADQITTITNTLNCSFRLHIPEEEQEIILSVPGRHNVQNAVAAAACCSAIGIDIDQIRCGLEKFRPVKGRLQLISTIKGARIYDDSYNANPDSLDAALKTIAEDDGNHWLVLGDMGELGDDTEKLHKESGIKAQEAGFERIFAIGEHTRFTVDEFGDGATHFTEVEALIDALKKELSSGVSVLVKGSRFMKMERITNALLEDN